ncbi:ankyrin repeat and BTB/POZ domain-containing protein BTBD11 isoform X2 [Lingula anatina]|uniref:Ankyrin repeat and BTB/POZ domain-containing protein BTBD11 isoform X2 n=1 Tax=Lingula anatina TaxID=7574 RepID=A0A1S3I297_LINAN|nr:ankyrin repeat and BTB/POZ domain-containing protein BTBD11 isoform X2 [Lingula anatina]|eukprot:XP_013391469.1 ankyrin repeat and BTB/POZ domain-containing protein BTBD11 isoform X2 [Lingula anatina]
MAAEVADLTSPLESLSLAGTNDSPTDSPHSYSFSSSHSPSQSSRSSHRDSDKSSGLGLTLRTLSQDYADPENSEVFRDAPSGYETMDTRISDEAIYPERFHRLAELEHVPWTDRDVLIVLQQGRTKELSGNISLELLQRLSYLLQRPLVRLANETQRLCQALCKCTKHEIIAAIKILLSKSLGDSCINACYKAGTLYAMSTNNFKQSKSAQCGLHFSIGRFHRWMIDSQIALRVQEMAAVYLAACLENLLEEILLLAVGRDQLGGLILGASALDYGISNVPELWGLVQPWEHLICGRNSTGMISLPSTLSMASLLSGSSGDSTGRRTRGQMRADSVMAKTLEQSLLATCVGTLTELGDLVSQSMHYWYNKSSAHSKPQHMVTWGPSALHTLYYYMRCSQLEHADNPDLTPPSIHLCAERPYYHQPPLLEWIRVATAHAEYRLSYVVDADDVRQAGRLLLPDVDCPPRQFGTDESLCTSRHLDAQTCATRFLEDTAFRMLACGRSDLVPQALALLGGNKVNSYSQQGLTPLMYACMRGDEAMVHILLDAGAALDVTVPNDVQRYPCVHPEVRQWTALHFAVVHGHFAVVQLLLDRGADVEGKVTTEEDNFVETPLQLAAAAGHYELVNLMLIHGADPFLPTYQKSELSFKDSTQGSYNDAFTMAASHGHMNVLSRLLTSPFKPQTSDILSLEEILAEGTMPNTNHCDNRHIDRIQSHSEQESMYNGAENGYLDIAMELRGMGVPWTIHTWTQSIYTAHATRRKAIVQCLVNDFSSIRYEENKEEFLEETLPLMFDIFRSSKNDVSSEELARIFSNMYGKAPLPIIQELRPATPTQIDSRYINNPEMSDIKFMIDNKPFYAHKIILANASNRFKTMMMSSKKGADGGPAIIEINDISYHIFELVMQYLYNGGSVGCLKVNAKDVFELLGAANFFLLEGLQRHCEVLMSHRLSVDNCCAIYKHAKLFSAHELVKYCEGYILQNMAQLLKSNESFRKLIHSQKTEGQEVHNGLLATITRRLEAKLSMSKSSKV